jgi:threonine aldolase
MVDLRSDTVTKPTPGMLQAMMAAEVGDDVFKEDPTMNAFQERVAAMFGFEAGVFVPTGVMGNQLCVNLLTKPGDEVILDKTAHIFNYESAAAPVLSGVQLHTLAGERGVLTPELISTGFRAHNDWDPRTSVIALENTTNKGGGACYSRKNLLAIRKVADERGVAVHIDGARIWNAMTATGIEPAFFGTVADTMSVCFSKGLGAPVGSMVLCKADLKREAFRRRKQWGGGMRQSGLLAAAAAYALDHHYPLIAADHRRARWFAEALAENPAYAIDPRSVQTNIVLFDVNDGDVAGALSRFREKGVAMTQFGPRTIRAVFHFQVDDEALATVVHMVER